MTSLIQNIQALIAQGNTQGSQALISALKDLINKGLIDTSGLEPSTKSLLQGVLSGSSGSPEDRTELAKHHSYRLCPVDSRLFADFKSEVYSGKSPVLIVRAQDQGYAGDGAFEMLASNFSDVIQIHGTDPEVLREASKKLSKLPLGSRVLVIENASSWPVPGLKTLPEAGIVLVAPRFQDKPPGTRTVDLRMPTQGDKQKAYLGSFRAMGLPLPEIPDNLDSMDWLQVLQKASSEALNRG